MSAVDGKTGDAPEDKNQNFDFVDWGPPPDVRQRQLIFDSLTKITNVHPSKNSRSHGSDGDKRGMFVFTWGAGYHGQLGRHFGRGQKKYSAEPLLLPMDAPVRQVACGGLFTAAVTESGQVYTWGEGKNGQLGFITETAVQVPGRVTSLDGVFITQIACGRNHCIALQDNGQIWSWGANRYGQCGHNKPLKRGDEIIVKVPGDFARNITAVSAGDKHSLAINRKGQVLSFGCGEHGQIGLGKRELSKENANEPTPIETMADKNVVAIACGAIHSVMITEEGEVYVCGFGEHFFPGEQQHFFYHPKHVAIPEPIHQAACGQSHILALSVHGNVWAWGSGEYQQIGYGVDGSYSTPRLILQHKNIAQVAAGRYHSFALSNMGVMYSWGCSENGQLGRSTDHNDKVPQVPEVVQSILGTVVGQVACGEHHSICLTSAPWTKVSQDMREWMTTANYERNLQLAYIKRLKRALNRKDFNKLHEDMKKWQAEQDARKAEHAEQEEQNLKTESASVEMASTLRATMLISHDSDDKKQKQPAPLGVQAQGLVESPNRGAPGQSSNNQRYGGKQNASKLAAQGRQTRTRNRTSAGSNRSISTAHDGTRTLASDKKLARADFLKETAAMVKRMTSAVQHRGEAASHKELQKLFREVFTCRKEYDTLRNAARKKQKVMDDLKRELKLMDNSHKMDEDSKQSRLEVKDNLEMQLNTVTIKIAETDENRKNYELNITHLKEEDFEHFNQLEALRKQCADNNSFFKKMNELKIQAIEEKDKAEGEVAEFKGEIESYQRFVHEQMGQFESILAIVRSQNDKREAAKAQRDLKTQAKVSARIERLRAEVEAADKEAEGLAARLTAYDLKLRHFEDSLQKITASTGLSNPDAIVNKFFFKGEIKEQLETEIEDKQNQIKKLQGNQRDLKERLKEAKSNFKDEAWRDVELLQEKFREDDVQQRKTQKEFERMSQRLAFVQEGIMSMMREVEQSVGVEEELELDIDCIWTPQQAESVFQRLWEVQQDLMERAAEREREIKAAEDKQKAEYEATVAMNNQKAGDAFLGVMEGAKQLLAAKQSGEAQAGEEGEDGESAEAGEDGEGVQDDDAVVEDDGEDGNDAVVDDDEAAGEEANANEPDEY